MQRQGMQQQREPASGVRSRQWVAVSAAMLVTAATAIGGVWYGQNRALSDPPTPNVSFVAQEADSLPEPAGPEFIKKKHEEQRALALKLRLKLRPWAMRHQDLLRRMLQAGPKDEAVLMEVWNALPALPGVETVGFTARDLPVNPDMPRGTLSATWNINKDSKPRSEEPEDVRQLEKLEQRRASVLRYDFAEQRDIALSDMWVWMPNTHVGTFYLWVSGRITWQPDGFRPAVDKATGKPLLGPNGRQLLGRLPHHQVIPSYDFLLPTKKTDQQGAR